MKERKEILFVFFSSFSPLWHCCYLLLLFSGSIRKSETHDHHLSSSDDDDDLTQRNKVFVKSVSPSPSSSALLALLFFPFAQTFVSSSLSFLFGPVVCICVSLYLSSSFGNYKAVICACVSVCVRTPDSIFLVFCLGFTCTGVYDDALVFHYKYFMRAR